MHACHNRDGAPTLCHAAAASVGVKAKPYRAPAGALTPPCVRAPSLTVLAPRKCADLCFTEEMTYLSAAVTAARPPHEPRRSRSRPFQYP